MPAYLNRSTTSCEDRDSFLLERPSQPREKKDRGNGSLCLICSPSRRELGGPEPFWELLHLNSLTRPAASALPGLALDLLPYLQARGTEGVGQLPSEPVRLEPGLRMAANNCSDTLLALGQDEQSRFHGHLMFYAQQKNVF